MHGCNSYHGFVHSSALRQSLEGSSCLLHVVSAEADPWIPGLLPRRLAHSADKPVLSWGGGPGASVVLHLDFHVASWTSSQNVSWSRREEGAIASLES